MPSRVARRIKQTVRDELRLTISVGVAPNKYLAKLASDLEKPDGLTVIREEDIDRILPPLPISKLWGIGPKTAARLNNLAIRTIGDLRKLPREYLEHALGIDADHYLRLAHGRDQRQVTPDRDAKSISQEETFGSNLTEASEVRDVLLGQVEQVARRLRNTRCGRGPCSSRSATASFTPSRGRPRCRSRPIRRRCSGRRRNGSSTSGRRVRSSR